MKNIIDILSDLGIAVPEDNHAALNKAVSENYRTVAEYEKKISRLEAERDTHKERADTAEQTLKNFEGIDPAKINEEVASWKKKAEEAEQAAKKQLEERDFNDALRAELDSVQFTSSAARKAVETDVRAAGLKLQDGKILGFADLIDKIRKEDASAFVDPQQQAAQQGAARFDNGTPSGGTPSGAVRNLGKMSMAEYIAARRNK